MRKKRKVILAKDPSTALELLWQWLQDDDVEKLVVPPHEAALQNILDNGALDVVVVDSHVSALHLQQLSQISQQARPYLGRMVTIFYPAALEQLADTPDSLDPGCDLSPRELEVLEYVARGWTNTEIAAALSVSKNTVGFHLKNIFEKLNVTNRTEAAMWYFEFRSSLT